MGRMENESLNETTPTPVNPTPKPEQPALPANETESTLAPHLAQTVPVSLPPTLPPGGPPAKTGRRMPSWRLLTLAGILSLLLIAATSAYGGYQAGIQQRTDAQEAQAALQAKEQFDLAMQDIEAKQYARARQRLEYIVQIDPNFPGITDKLAEVILSQNTTATPTIAPTPTVTPTPDMRSVQELFDNAQQSLANSDWNTTINTLLALRKSDPTFQPVQVDDMLYVSLRNRGKDKILKTTDLEGGIYDLSLAERFGPLDADAQSYVTWARIYLTGASFWELDWSQAVYYFAQVAPALPNLRDGSGWTASERYRLALVGYGDDFFEAEEWCDAQAQYETSLSLGSDPEVEEKLADASGNCGGGDDDGDSDNEDDGDSDDSEDSGDTEATEEPPAESTPSPDSAEATVTP
jgi:hypothetical protein